SNKEKKELINELERITKTELKIKKEDIYYLENENLYLLKNIPIAIKYENKIIPTIFLLINLEADISYVIVDDGAKDKILNGADIFRPGIIEFDKNIKKGDIVMILSEKNELLGVGISLFDSEEIEKIQKGKIVKLINYYGDKITNLYKELNKR
ncbi:MAG: DUF1947 domain-containing protein, partial [Nanopusillaceae archaeon]